MEFSISSPDAEKLKAVMKKSPQLLKQATAQMLNSQAFGTRTKAIEQISKTMTVRNKSFVSRQIRTTKASPAASIFSQKAITGSMATARFSGWAEQQLGTHDNRKRFGTLQSRGGSRAGQMKPSMRLKPGTDIAKIDDYKPKGGTSNYGGFIAMLLRKGEKRLVNIKGGIYKLPRASASSRKAIHGPTQTSRPLYRKVLTLIQERHPKQPHINHWLTDARANYFKTTDLDALWARTCKALFKQHL